MKEKIRVFLVHLIFFILSIWPLLIWFGALIEDITYCKFYDCSGYNDARILYLWILGVIIVNVIFYFGYKFNYNKKRD